MSVIKKPGVCLIGALMMFTLLSGTSHASGAQGEITVSAAMSLKNAFEDIGRLYDTRHKGKKVVFNFGASGDLIRQIENGAPVDVFASADQKEMDELDGKGLVAPGSRADFTANSIVLVVPSYATATIKSFDSLKAAGIKKIAIGNPKTVPSGMYAQEVFASYRINDSLKDKLVLTENVRQALDYVARGEVDAGIVYATDAMTRTKEVRIVITAPELSHKPVIYPIAVIKGTKNDDAARAFISLVMSAEGKKVLEKYGFRAVKR